MDLRRRRIVTHHAEEIPTRCAVGDGGTQFIWLEPYVKNEGVRGRERRGGERGNGRNFLQDGGRNRESRK
jgi:hypothetical protein